MKIIQDYHMHSTFSEDGSDAPEAMCRRAIELGIPEIGFSEHWDVGPFERNPYFFQPEKWFAEIQRLRAQFAGQLVIRAGIEIAEPHLYNKQADEVLRRLDFDYVIGSVHWDGTNFMFDSDYFSTHTADEVYRSYFSELEKMVSVSDIDIVAHFDIPSRTAIPILGYQPERYQDQIRNILAIIIQRSLCLDINVAGLRKPSQNIMPDPIILKWYSEMGGRHITLGSDAHRISEVGLNLEKAIPIILATGITEVTQFQQRQHRQVRMTETGI